jgi:hypothetical protein
MRATSLLRFVIFGAVGFGIGWTVAGLFAVMAPMWSPYTSYFFAGACGGAGLGLAPKDWKRVAALALTGMVGFGLGTHFMFILGFIGLLPGWTSIAMYDIESQFIAVMLRSVLNVGNNFVVHQDYPSYSSRLLD